MSKILGIGIAAVDIINVTDGYPKEDDEVRAVRQSVRRGGNTTNTLVVLSQLGHQCEWLGTLADDVNSQVIINDLDSYGVNYLNSQRIINSKTPTSYITLNQRNGSRTIVHFRDLPELTAKAIETVKLRNFQWVHFEGRNVSETRCMMDYVRRQSTALPISVEIEKPREHLDQLFPGADVYFFSRAFALTQQFDSAVTLLNHYHEMIPEALLVCTWGEDGAYALHKDNLFHAPAAEISTVVDTIGAGDTFNAGFIHSRLRGDDCSTALAFACRLAARKCTLDGFAGLTEIDS